MTPPRTYAVECGYVAVPAHTDFPEGPQIRLAVAIVYSNAKTVARDPVVYLDGGPGEATLSPFLGAAIPFDSVLQDHDLVLFDQRGTGFSRPLPLCNQSSSVAVTGGGTPDAGADGGGASDALSALTDCHDQAIADGVDLSIFRSRETAADVASLRKTLGYAHWNVYGISYGTRYALATLRDQPTGIDSVILDSVVPPEVDLLADEGVSVYGALHKISDACLAQSDCGAAFGNVESKELTILERMDAGPPTITLDDGTSVTVPARLASSLFTTLMYSGAAIRALPAIVQEIYDQDYSVFKPAFTQSGSAVLDEGTYLSVICAEEAPFSSRGALSAASQEVPAEWRKWVVPTDIYDACAIWNVPAAAPTEHEAVTSSAPTLVLSGSFDPVTPPPYGALAAQTLSKSQSFVLGDQAHASSISDCGKTLVHQFLDSPTSKIDARCANGAILSFETPATPALSPGATAATSFRFTATREVPPSNFVDEAVRRAALRHRLWR